MRVLSVGNMYPPHHFGGYEQVWHAAVEHLRERGHDVRVLTTAPRTAATAPDDPGVHRDLRWHLQDGEFRRLSIRERRALTSHNHDVLRRHLADHRPDVVTWWSMGGLTLTLLEDVRVRGVPAVAMVHDDWLDYGRYVDPWLALFTGSRRRPLATLARWLTGLPTSVSFDDAATYLFVSEHTRRHAFARGHALRRTAVVHSGISPDFLRPAPERDWSWRLLYVGRLDPRKGVATAVQALARLPVEATLDVAGGGDLREERRLRELSRAEGVADRVRFLGHRDRNALPEVYAAADAVVFPVVWQEPWGLVPLEAMAVGRPVVATGRGGSGEYLRDGENCLRFEAGDADALAAAIRRLAGDPALRARLRAAGLATAPRHTEDVLNHGVEAAIIAATEGASSRRA